MKKEKVLVSENSIRSCEAIEQAKDAALLINSDMIPRLKKLGIEITQEVFMDLFTSRGKTEKTHYDTLNADISKMKSPSIVSVLQETGKRAWWDFESEFSKVKSEVKQMFQFLTIVDDQAVLLSEGEDRISEQFRVYLSDPKEIEAYQLHVEVIEKLNSLFGRVPYKWETIFSEDGAGKFTRNEATDYSKIVATWNK